MSNIHYMFVSMSKSRATFPMIVMVQIGIKCIYYNKNKNHPSNFKPNSCCSFSTKEFRTSRNVL